MTVTLPTAPARDVLASLVRERVMGGVESLLTDGREITFRELAKVSGVAERTLYRHFPTKEALLEAFWRWLNSDQLALREQPSSLPELLAHVRAAFEAFDRKQALVRAMLHDPEGRALRRSQAPERLRALRLTLDGQLRGLPAARQKKLLALVRLLTSASAWEVLCDAGGLRSSDAAEAACWALEALCDGAALASARADDTRARPHARSKKRVRTTRRAKKG